MGGNLAKVQNQAVNDFLRFLDSDSASNTWIGARVSAGSATWPDGTAVSYSDFVSGSVVGPDSCVYQGPDGSWFESSCTASLPSFCEVCASPDAAGTPCSSASCGSDCLALADLGCGWSKQFNTCRLGSVTTDEELTLCTVTESSVSGGDSSSTDRSGSGSNSASTALLISAVAVAGLVLTGLAVVGIRVAKRRREESLQSAAALASAMEWDHSSLGSTLA